MLEPKKVALAVGLMSGVVHIVWSVVVLVGLGQSWVNFVTGMHFVSTTMTVLPFNFVTAVEVTAIAIVMAYVGGFVFATIWNKVQK